jgi:hypothetical protein
MSKSDMEAARSIAAARSALASTREALEQLRALRKDLEEVGYIKSGEPSPYERAADRHEQKQTLRVIKGGRDG